MNSSCAPAVLSPPNSRTALASPRSMLRRRRPAQHHARAVRSARQDGAQAVGDAADLAADQARVDPARRIRRQHFARLPAFDIDDGDPVAGRDRDHRRAASRHAVALDPAGQVGHAAIDQHGQSPFRERRPGRCFRTTVAPEEMLKDAGIPINDQKARSVGNWSELVARMQQDTGLQNSGIDPREFRSALGCFPTGVTIITTIDPRGQCIGITANSFNSVSMDPPLILFSLARGAYSMRVLPLHRPFRRQRPESGAGRTLDPLRQGLGRQMGGDRLRIVGFRLPDPARLRRQLRVPDRAYL